jgi:hypothetical protein
MRTVLYAAALVAVILAVGATGITDLIRRLRP